jgi:hypothetical protein
MYDKAGDFVSVRENNALSRVPLFKTYLPSRLGLHLATLAPTGFPGD